jgi:hypothetical protein
MSVAPMALVPSARARAAENLAQAVTGGRAPTEQLCSLVADLRERLGVEHAAVSIISDRQIVVVADGHLVPPPTAGADSPAVSPLEDTICVLAVRADQQVGIADAAQDDRVASTPPVASGEIGSYLGSPLRLAGAADDDPMTVGVLCIYNTAVREWTPADSDELERTALAVAAELDRVRDTARGAA